MVDDHALRRALTQYVRTTLGTYSIGETLYRLTDLVVEVIGCDGAGVSVGDAEGRLRFVTATDAFVVPAEEAQVRTQDGPCYEAFTTAKVVTAEDLAAEGDRWPKYSDTALASGSRAVMGVPMGVEDASIGAVNLYHRRPHIWTDQELEAAGLLSDMAAGYIANLRTLEGSQRLSVQLQQALDSRVVIEQAKGIIAARHELDVATAFQRLRRMARDRQCRIHDVARDVVDQRLEL